MDAIIRLLRSEYARIRKVPLLEQRRKTDTLPLSAAFTAFHSNEP